MDLKQALQKAIEFEQKGRAVYDEAAFKTENEAVAKIFIWLAEQELQHERWIKAFIEEKGMDLPPDPVLPVKEFFKSTTKEFRTKLVLSDDDVSAYDQAMQLERESYEYYKEQLESADDDAKALLGSLMEQEQAHYDLLEQTRDYLSDPDLFYQREEGWLFEG